MSLADLPAVMEIENQAFSNPWSVDMVKKELSQDWSTVLLAELWTPRGWLIRAFAIFWLVHDEIHVLNVATHQELRRQGIGRQVMDAVIAFGRDHKCRIATLEVRRGNGAALGLYQSLGFRTVGLRPNYYQDDREDAVVMIMDL
ncbi:MAG: ribosomal protein S18-alanine N-acetyltransferase [Myxococcales bacterium]|nr:ribosomal protein S18-alanine N-acetyltransferase [Myxococcales bacterium]